MKKSIFAVSVMLYCLLITITGRAQNNIEVPSAVKESFANTFKNSDYQRWVKVKDSYVATFKRNEAWGDAYFTAEGEYKGIGKFITTNSLPEFVAKSIDEDYPAFQVFELYQYESTDSGLSFYAVLKNEKNQLVLQFNPYGDLTFSRKTKIKGPKPEISDVAISKK